MTGYERDTNSSPNHSLVHRNPSKGFPNSSASTNSLLTCTPDDLMSSKRISSKSPYKSLPALDKDFDNLEKEIHNISESFELLYHQEDNELQFMETFLDYDSISTNGV